MHVTESLKNELSGDRAATATREAIVFSGWLTARLAITPTLIGGLSYAALPRRLRPRYYVSREREG